jgi:hypothetical protein
MSTTVTAYERGIPAPALRRLARRTKNNAVLHVLLLLRELADETGRVAVTREAIISHTGLSTTGVTNAVALLVSAKLLEHETHQGQNRGYRLRILSIPERDERPIASARA